MPIVVIRIGQSNSVGAASLATIDASYQQTFPNIKTWTGSTFESLSWATNNNQYPNLWGSSGSEFAILTLMQSHYGETIYDIKNGHGGTYLGTSASPSENWNTSTRGSWLDTSFTAINNAFAYMWTTLGLRSDFKIFIFWDQGEADSDNITDASNYQTNYTSLINKIKNSFGTCCSNVIWINPYVNSLLDPTGTDATISGATNANPIVITTQTAHGLTSGRTVVITGVSGNTAANGTFVITVTSTTKFSIPIAGNGTYTSGGNVNRFPYSSTVISAQQNVIGALSNCYGYATSSYVTSEGVHYTATGYKDKGTYAVNNIIIPNNL